MFPFFRWIINDNILYLGWKGEVITQNTIFFCNEMKIIVLLFAFFKALSELLLLNLNYFWCIKISVCVGHSFISIALDWLRQRNLNVKEILNTHDILKVAKRHLQVTNITTSLEIFNFLLTKEKKKKRIAFWALCINMHGVIKTLDMFENWCEHEKPLSFKVAF